jgi:hypothetical protein
MKTHFYIFNRLILLVLTVIFVQTTAWCQENPFEVAESQSAEESALTFQEVVVGGGLQLFDVAYFGYPQASGSFTGNSGIGFTGGFLLTSGKALLAKGPNTSPGVGYSSNTPGDPDLTLLAGENSMDASIIEFSFISTTGYFSINYVFASEEYPKNVNIDWNDVFGIFLSGPGISGPFTNNAVNIALIPGTDEPVSINTVNSESHPEYYVANWSPVQNNNIQYDGYTVPMRAEATVTPFETYRVKIAISDAGDRVYDSGIFIEEGSLTDAVPTRVAESQELDSPRIFPNPSSHTVWVVFPEKELSKKSLEVINMAGQVVLSHEVSGNQLQLNETRELSTGVYTLKFIQEDNFWFEKLIIK